MIASGTGLVVILDRADAASVETAATLSTELDIAVVDRRTWQALTRMGTLGPTRPVPAPIVVAVEPALFGLARRQLAAAEALLERALAGPALGLLAEAMLARTAAVAGRDAPPASHDAAAWLFVEAIPKGFAPAEVAHAILCAQSLAHAPTVPDAVVADVAARARSFVAA
ncbi:MAG: hypothetical protein U1F43_32380 [Myxococcota bacterium]